MKRWTYTLCGLMIAVFVSALVVQPVSAATTGIPAYSLVCGNLIPGYEHLSSFDAISNGVIVAFAGSGDSVPAKLVAVVAADGDTSGGAFVGNYEGVAGITFRVHSDGSEPTHFDIELLGGHTPWLWRHVLISDDPGEWTINNIPFVRSAGWWQPNINETNAAILDAAWDSDIQNLPGLSLLIKPSVGSQAYTISQLILLDASDFSADSITLTVGEVALLDFFHVLSVGDLEPWQLTQSTLVTGMTDVDVLLSLNDPAYYANNTFVVTTAPGIKLRWVAKEGRTYDIYRTEDLVAGFTEAAISGASGITPTGFERGIGFVEYDDSPEGADGPYFYKIIMRGE